MLIHTIWEQGEPEDMPWLVDAVDEYTIDGVGMSPEYLTKLAERNRRELIISIPEADVRKLFESPVVRGTIKHESAQ